MARPRDDDDDYEPRKPRSKKKSGLPIWVLAVGGVAVLVVALGAVVGAILLLRPVGGKPGGGGGLAGAGGALIGNAAPAGFTDVRDSEGGYRVLLPGQIRKAEARADQAPLKLSIHGGTDGTITVTSRSFQPPPPFNPGTSPDQLFTVLKKWQPGLDTPWNEIESKTPVTLGRKPGLVVKVKEKKNWMDSSGRDPEFHVPPGLPPDEKKKWEDDMREHKRNYDEMKKKHQKEEASRPGRREVFLLATDGQRLVIINLHTKGDAPDDATIKTITDSFEFSNL